MKKREKQKPNEMRMKASEFEKIMRHALGTPPLERKRPNKSKKRNKQN